jgi:hypothetical protein
VKRIQIILTDSAGQSAVLDNIEVNTAVSQIIDDFESVVGSDQASYEPSNSPIVVMATRQTSAYLKQAALPDNTSRMTELYTCLVTVNTIPYFRGFARVRAAEKNFKTSRYEIELIRAENDFWELCDQINLRSLQLGSIAVTPANIQTSWANAYPTSNFIFAPVIYGQPTGASIGTVATFAPADFRPAVYYPAIIAAIEQATGYRLMSNFAALPIFQDSVYLFSVGDTAVEKVPLSSTCPFSFVRFNSKTFATGTTIDYDQFNDPCAQVTATLSNFTVTTAIDVSISFSGIGTNIASVELRKNNVAVYTATALSSTTVSGSRQLSLVPGDIITLALNGVGGGSATLTTFSWSNNITNPAAGSGIIQSTIQIASCLHDSSIKQFLRGISHQFGLVWKVDAIAKIVYYEPRFRYRIDGTNYDGFYLDTDIQQLKIQPGQVQLRNMDYFGDWLELCYQQEGSGLFDALQRYTDGLPVDGVRFALTDAERTGEQSANPYFAVLPNYDTDLVAATMLPAILPDGYEQGDPLPTDWEAEGQPVCGLVYRGNASVFYDAGAGAVNTVMPLVAQTISSYRPNGAVVEKQYVVSYADSQAINAGNSPVILPGLATTFYLQYFCMVSAPLELSAQFRVSPAWVHNASFERVYNFPLPAMRTGWLLLAAQDFEPSRTQGTTLRMLHYRKPLITDLLRLQQPVNLLSTDTALCDYSANDTMSFSPQQINRNLTAITLASGWILPLAYPYVGAVAGEDTRLFDDLVLFFAAAGIQYSSMTVKVNIVSGSQRWLVSVNDTNLVLQSMTIEASISIINAITFTKTC